MNLFIEQRTAKHHNKHQAQTLKIQDISVRRDVKTFSEENCPCGRQMPKQLWQRKKGEKYERTEGTTIIYVNNVPLLLIISGKIKQKRKGGGRNITHVTQLIFLMQINNRNYKWKWCCCDGEKERFLIFLSLLRSVWNSLSGEASRGRCSLTQRVKSIAAAAGGNNFGLLFSDRTDLQNVHAPVDYYNFITLWCHLNVSLVHLSCFGPSVLAYSW